MTTSEPTTGEIEEWKPVYGYDGIYEVSNSGKVRSMKAELLPYKRGRNYLSVKLCNAHGQKSFTVHRLVAIAFCEKLNGYDCVNHINGNKDDNRAKNLEWCTNTENVRHAFLNGLNTRSERPVIRTDTKERFRSTSEAARSIGVPPREVIRCCRRQRGSINGIIFDYESSTVTNRWRGQPQDGEGK